MAEITSGFHKGINRGHMNRTLEEELEAFLVNGALPCAVAFKIAKRLKVTPKQVGDTANKLNIKIVNCQLGCFP